MYMQINENVNNPYWKQKRFQKVLMIGDTYRTQKSWDNIVTKCN